MGNNKGMSLVEVMVGMLVMAILSILLLMLYTSTVIWSVRAGDRTKNISQAAGIAENALAGMDMEMDAEEAIIYITDAGVTTAIDNANLQVAEEHKLTVVFNGSQERDVYVRKITITTEKDTYDDNTLQSEIEVYKP